MKDIRDSTLEQIENDIWKDPGKTTGLVRSVHQLRKKPLKDFTIEDCRITIGQNMSLDHLIPIAIEKLTQDILAEGAFYPGDLLVSVLNSNENYWQKNRDQWKSVNELIKKNRLRLQKENDREIVKSVKKFKAIHID